MTSRSKRTDCLALVEKNSGLAFPDGQLCAVFDLRGAFFRQTVDKLLAGFVKPF